MSRYQFAIDRARICRDRSQVVVFHTGCFDIFHYGHLDALKQAASFGKLFVGVGSDETVGALKGSDRPFFRESDRARIINELECVEFAFVLSEPCINRIDHAEAIELLRPDIWCLPNSDPALEAKKALASKYDIGLVIHQPTPYVSSSTLGALIKDV